MFFKQLSELGADLDVSIRIKEKNGKLTVMFTPEVGNKTAVIGKVITGTPEDLDADFIAEIKKPAAAPAGTSVQDLPTEQTPAKPAAEKPAKPAAQKADKKGAKKKAGKHGKVAAANKTAPTVQAASMFDQQPEAETENAAVETEDPETVEEDDEAADPEADELADTEDQPDSETE